MRGHLIFVALAGMLAACGGGELFPQNEQVVAAPDGQPGPVDSLNGQQLEAGVELQALENASLRREPSPSATVLMVIPREATLVVLEGTPRDGFYEVSFAGMRGWTYGAHHRERVSLMTSRQELSSSDILKRAATGVGFSYWWGHGAWSPGSSSHGSCAGSCPSCSHSGSYGADCSGFVAKAWQVPSTNVDYAVDSHPYSTYDFENTSANWDPVSRGDAQPGDAFVYNDGGAGHIFLFEKGDPWGSMWTYECKGCADGCVHNVRSSVPTAYKAIRRRGLTAPSGATSDPSAVSWSAGRLDVFVRGADNALWHSWYDSGTWYGWQSLGGTLSSGPDAASWGSGRLDVFARDTSNNIVQKYYNGSAWSAWVSHGAPPGGASSDPSVVTWGSGRLDVFVRGADNALWHRWFSNGTWYSWQSLGGVLTSAPDAATWGVNRLDVFSRDGNNNIIQKYYNGSSWSPWVVRGGPATSSPGAEAWGPDRLDLFARGSDNSLIQQYWNGTSWSAWVSLGGILTSGPDVTSWGAGRLDVVARNTNNDIVHKWFVSGNGWSTWENLGSP